jgi:SAM-dependent methyltransferase
MRSRQVEAAMTERRDPEPGERDTGWAAYYRQTKGREPRPLFAKGMAAIEATGPRVGDAVEIGFGDGTETLALLRLGWRVLAIDPTPDAATALRSQVAEADAARLRIVTAPAEETDLPPFDFLYAGYSLPFLGAEKLPAFWAEMRRQLRPGGLIAVNLFGIRDSWASNPDLAFVDADAVRRMVDGLDVIALDEEDQDGDSFLGPKHWHVFDVVARQQAREVA